MLNFTVIPIKLETEPLPIAERESYFGDDIYYKPSSAVGINGSSSAEEEEGDKKKEGGGLFKDVLESIAFDQIGSAAVDMIL